MKVFRCYKEMRTSRRDCQHQGGERQVKRTIRLYALPMIIAIGYRVRSSRGTQFRQWATRTLGEYLSKGFAMDDERLKMSFKGRRVRKADVVIAKNHLEAGELDHLNRLVSMFFEFAELRAKQRQHLQLDDWRNYIDNFMAFNEQPLLNHKGNMSRERMTEIAHQRYEDFDGKRKQAEALQADREELEALEKLAARLQGTRQKEE